MKKMHKPPAPFRDPRDIRTDAVLLAGKIERCRQEHLHIQGNIPFTCVSPIVSCAEKLAVLTEEIGEVARAVQERDKINLREELIQVAAVAVAWAVSLPAPEPRKS